MSHDFRLPALALLLSVVWWSTPVKAQEAWSINTFNSDITVQESGIVDIEETIQVTYNDEKHGIFRTIPHTYSNGSKKEYTKVEIIEVQRNGKKESFSREQNSANLRLKVGDAEQTLRGDQTYKLHYRVTGILKGYTSYDELYWNVTGNDWEVPIQQTTATITIPKPGIQQASCYYGSAKSTTKCTHRIDGSSVTFSHLHPLEANQGMTIAAGYTKGLVPLLTVSADEMKNPMSHATTLITAGILALAGLLALTYIKQRYGSDNLRNVSIAPEYTAPDNIRPAELGLIIDQRADTLDVSATIVDLANRGYLSITEEPKKWVFGSIDYVFKRINPDNSGLLNYESMLLSRLFEDAKPEDINPTVRLSALKNTFYQDLGDIKRELYKEGTAKGFFPKNPESVRTAYVLGSVLAFGSVLGIFIFVYVTQFEYTNTLVSHLTLGFLFGLTLTMFMSMFFAPFMARRTAKGRELYRRSLGYKLFLSNTEKYRQPFFESQNIFMDILPYAMIFGVTKKLAESFEAMGIQPPQPSWYYGAHAFNIASFNDSMDTFSKSLNSAMASSPSSSGSAGGGFSGGGFGGGGGGSW